MLHTCTTGFKDTDFYIIMHSKSVWQIKRKHVKICITYPTGPFETLGYYTLEAFFRFRKQTATEGHLDYTSKKYVN